MLKPLYVIELTVVINLNEIETVDTKTIIN